MVLNTMPSEQPRTLLQQMFMPRPRTQPQARVEVNREPPYKALTEPMPGSEVVNRFLKSGPLGAIKAPLPTSESSVADIVSMLFVPQTKGDVLLSALPVGWIKNAKNVPLNKLSRFAMREGVPREEMSSALGKTLGGRLRSVKLGKERVAEDLFEDAATGERVNLNQLRAMFGDEVLQEADLIPYTPKPLDRPSGSMPSAVPERWSLSRELSGRQLERDRDIASRAAGGNVEMTGMPRTEQFIQESRERTAARRSARQIQNEISDIEVRAQDLPDYPEPEDLVTRHAELGEELAQARTRDLQSRTTQQLEYELSRMDEMSPDAIDISIELERRQAQRARPRPGRRSTDVTEQSSPEEIEAMMDEIFGGIERRGR